ncbi:MAG: hypothetical protein ACYS8W_00370 [Planctomycetota bacterium]
MEKKFLPFYVGVLLLGIIISVFWNIGLDVSARGRIKAAVKSLEDHALSVGKGGVTLDSARAKYLKTVIPDSAWLYQDFSGINGWNAQATQLFDYFAKNVQSVDDVTVEYNFERLAALVKLDLTLKPDEEGNSRKVQRRIMFVQHHVRPTADGVERWIEWAPFQLMDENAMVEGVLRRNLNSYVPESPKKKLGKMIGGYLKSYSRNHVTMKDSLVKLYVDSKYTPFKVVFESHTKTVLKKKELLDNPDLISQINSLILDNFGNEGLATALDTWKYGEVIAKYPYVVKTEDGRASIVRVMYAIGRHRNPIISNWVRDELNKQALQKLEPLWPAFGEPGKPLEAGQISIEDPERFKIIRDQIPKFVESKGLQDEMIKKINDMENGFKVRREDIVKTANKTDESGKKIVLREGVEFTEKNCQTMDDCKKVQGEFGNYGSELFRMDAVDQLLNEWTTLRKTEPNTPAYEHFNLDKIRFAMLELIPEAARGRIVPAVQNIRGEVFKSISNGIDRRGRIQNEHRKVMELTIEDRLKNTLQGKLCAPVTAENLEAMQKWATEEHAEVMTEDEKTSAKELIKAIYDDLRKEMKINPEKITNYEAEHYFTRNYYFVQRAVPGSGGKLTVGWFPMKQIDSYCDDSGLEKLANKALERQKAARTKAADSAEKKNEQ